MATKLSTYPFKALGRPSQKLLRQTCYTTATTRAQWLLQKPRHQPTSRAYSAETAPPPPPPLLAKLKGDLKAAMKAKDATRLAVLRSVLSATLNASKTDSPIKTDLQLVALLHKTARTINEAIDGFRKGERQDLVEKEQAQLAVLEEYIAGSGIKTIEEPELRRMAEYALTVLSGSPTVGAIMKALLAPGGPLYEKQFDGSKLGKVVKDIVKDLP
ncbi:Yqey-like protein-domain-containing protein [Lasiosphaeris hirsuta]|uniref:Altered inheritance of mitochondria protein 41 n=1 Tax=Lasiosphaeris hirsuta TaxID=260670 RepID=A0AA40AFJ0_9PEZI|nr:Yqey-like protein-domain-containing protein [Lasiosphaeris hirsuta]